jgi:acyl-CoA thioesterase-1
MPPPRPRPRRSSPLVLLVLAAVAACGDGSRDAARGGPPARPPDAGGAARAAPDGPGEAADLPVVVFLGDSLTAGYQLPAEQAFPAVLAERLAAEGLPFRAVNAGSSGDTSAGGLARLDWVLRSDPDVVVVELGANDALRGQDLAVTEANLREIVRRLEARGVAVLLVGLRIPPNYGADYAERFVTMYRRVAAETGVPLVPFLLAGVGGEEGLNLADGIHPNAEGHRQAADNVAPYLRPLVAGAGAGAAAAAPPAR